MPNRPGAMLSMVDAMRAAIAGGRVRTADGRIQLDPLVTAAMPAISVKLSSAWSQNSLSPPKPRSLTIERANSNPYFSASSVTSRLSAKLGPYCGEVFEISQPLLAIGMKTPSSLSDSGFSAD